MAFDFKSCGRAAVMGGAFDPIHYAHLVTAQAVYDSFDVDRVVLMPLGNAAHKKMEGAGAADRYEMTRLAVEGNPAFEVSDMEVKREGKTYTVDTVAEIMSINPQLRLYFVMGADEILSVESWREPERLLKMCSFIAVNRPGYGKDDVREKIEALKEKYDCDIHFLEIPWLGISSSDIRKRIRENRAIKYLLPEKTERYIFEKGLYKEGNTNA